MTAKLSKTIGVYGGLGVYGGGGVYRSASVGAFKHDVMEISQKIDVQFTNLGGLLQGLSPIDPAVTETNDVYQKYQEILEIAMNIEDGSEISNKDKKYYTGSLLAILDWTKEAIKNICGR